jgi:hypothetical protein
MTYSTIQWGVLQIHLNTSSNTNLNYKFMASLTSQTRQHERFHLNEIFQHENQVRTEHIIRQQIK